MVFGKKNKEEEDKKELTRDEAIVVMGKSMAAISSRLDKMEKQPQEQPKEVEQPVQPQPQVKKDIPKFMVYDQPIKHKRVIIDNTDPENPAVYDIESALATLLNDVEKLKKALA